MKPSTYIKGLAAMWLAIPITALDYALAWDRLPERVVMKMNERGQPIAWATRGDAMTLSLGVLGFALIVATVVGSLVALQKQERMGAALVGIVCTVVAMTLLVNGILWAVQVP